MYKLVVSNTLTFTLRWTMLDGDVERVFAARAQADRPPGGDLAAAVKDEPIYAKFLALRNLKLLAWDGDAPLVDDAGQPAPADAAALDFLLTQQGVAHALFLGYVDAIGAKAKLGN